MNWIKALATLSLSAVLAACGGGDKIPGSTGTGTTGTPSVTLSLSSFTVTSAAPSTVTATVRDSSGALLTNQFVGFATTLGYGVIRPATALTNASGQAIVIMSPKDNTTVGADTLIASTTINAVAVTGSTGFQLSATDVAITSFTSDLAGGSLAAYGQTALTVVVSGAASGASVNLGITSACISAGKATVSPASTTTTTGTATFIYKDTGGCGSTFTSDTVQATVAGTSNSKSLTLALTSPLAIGINFVSASPQTIFLRGSGYVATSNVTFEVVDVSNNPLPGKIVTMEATTYTGGLTLDGVLTPVVKTSDSAGLVTVLINAGSVPTPVRVKATLAGSITTVSSNLSIAVGLPTQTAFSLSEQTFNIEGYNIDGIPNTYTVIASDRMGNPVPAGTSINFVSEGGQIVAVGQIALVNGLASTTVNFQSASPRPTNGRITVVAYALGEESFIDANGNNVYDEGEDFQDLGGVFISRKFVQAYDELNDQLIPQSVNVPAACRNASSPLLLLDRTVPSAGAFGGASQCDGKWGQAFVRRAIETVFSTSAARPFWSDLGGAAIDSNCRRLQDLSQTVIGDDGNPVTNNLLGYGSLYGLNPSGGTLTFLTSDANPERLNPMAAGTLVSATATTNLTATVLAGSPVPNTLSVTAAAVSYAFTNGQTIGTITLSFKSPSGLTTSFPIAVSTSATSPNGACPH